MEKKELRSLIRSRKSKCSETELQCMSVGVCRKVSDDPVWRTANTVLLYSPLKDEVDVRPLIAEAVAAHKRVLLPVVDGDNLTLRIYEGEKSMAKGAFGIMEPTGSLFHVNRYNEIGLAIIPGMAFDSKGHRLGRGKGYYDRLLPHLPQTFLMGVCFHFQLLDDVPSEPHDVLMHSVVSALP